MYELYDSSGVISEIADEEFLKSLFTFKGVARVGVALDFVGDGVARSSLKLVAASKRLYLQEIHNFIINISFTRKIIKQLLGECNYQSSFCRSVLAKINIRKAVPSSSSRQSTKISLGSLDSEISSSVSSSSIKDLSGSPSVCVQSSSSELSNTLFSWRASLAKTM